MEHVLFHGGVPGPKRKELIRRFQESPSCRLFLSTDAGGVGLNCRTPQRSSTWTCRGTRRCSNSASGGSIGSDSIALFGWSTSLRKEQSRRAYLAFCRSNSPCSPASSTADRMKSSSEAPGSTASWSPSRRRPRQRLLHLSHPQQVRPPPRSLGQPGAREQTSAAGAVAQQQAIAALCSVGATFLNNLGRILQANSPQEAPSAGDGLLKNLIGRDGPDEQPYLEDSTSLARNASKNCGPPRLACAQGIRWRVFRLDWQWTPYGHPMECVRQNGFVEVARKYRLR